MREITDDVIMTIFGGKVQLGCRQEKQLHELKQLREFHPPKVLQKDRHRFPIIGLVVSRTVRIEQNIND